MAERIVKTEPIQSGRQDCHHLPSRGQERRWRRKGMSRGMGAGEERVSVGEVDLKGDAFMVGGEGEIGIGRLISHMME
jgi:hypothetical protein